MPQIDIADLTVHYIEKGSGDTLLIFPDHLQSSIAYADEIDHFSDRFHVLSFDYPGTGQSTREALYPDEEGPMPLASTHPLPQPAGHLIR
jgi:pimeloyl-ACP methyl ester carboxylesterase